MANLKIQYDENKEYYDIFGENGSLAKEQGLDTQIFASILVDSRADDSEVPIKELQRGWAGNIYTNSDVNYQMGCRQWLYTEQERATQQTAEKIRDTIINDGLKWLVDDGFMISFDVAVDIESYTNIEIDLTLNIDENNTDKKKIILWNNTGT